VKPDLTFREPTIPFSLKNPTTRSSPLAPYTASKFAREGLSEALAQEMKTLNAPVAIVEPGIIETTMASRIGESIGNSSSYPKQRRMPHLFVASLKNPALPLLVAEKIRGIIESGTWQVRHPVGPDAEPFLAWHKSMTDEAWVDLHSADDYTWYRRMERDFGLAIRPEN
jgi:NAD(P)-dependent dehydrogenase (short-subunit alcohol dehydrogenase family)